MGYFAIHASLRNRYASHKSTYIRSTFPMYSCILPEVEWRRESIFKLYRCVNVTLTFFLYVNGRRGLDSSAARATQSDTLSPELVSITAS